MRTVKNRFHMGPRCRETTGRRFPRRGDRSTIPVMLACTIRSRAAYGLAVPLAVATASAAAWNKVPHEHELAKLGSEAEQIPSTTDETPPDKEDPVERSFLPLVEPAPISRRLHGFADGKDRLRPGLQASEGPPRPCLPGGSFFRRRAAAVFLPRTLDGLAPLVGPRAPPATT